MRYWNLCRRGPKSSIARLYPAYEVLKPIPDKLIKECKDEEVCIQPMRYWNCRNISKSISWSNCLYPAYEVLKRRKIKEKEKISRAPSLYPAYEVLKLYTNARALLNAGCLYPAYEVLKQSYSWSKWYWGTKGMFVSSLWGIETQMVSFYASCFRSVCIQPMRYWNLYHKT